MAASAIVLGLESNQSVKAGCEALGAHSFATRLQGGQWSPEAK